MANFGFRRLAIVAPFEPHWREAKSAIGAEELLHDARCAQCLAEAASECTLVIGTATLAHRKPRQRVVSLPDLAPIVRRELACGGQVAFVFGSEKRGLTGEDLVHCHLLVEIPTDPRQPSMNLGQAVAVCLYEIASHAAQPGEAGKESQLEQRSNPANLGGHAAAPVEELPATSGDVDLLAGIVEQTMLAANYSPSIMRKANRHDTRVLLRRLTLTRRDVRRILGLFRRILWRLQHSTGHSHH